MTAVFPFGLLTIRTTPGIAGLWNLWLHPAAELRSAGSGGTERLMMFDVDVPIKKTIELKP